MTTEDVENGDWYISGAHGRRALGYLGAMLATEGIIPPDFEQPRLLEMWGEALGATMKVEDNPPSPIGAPAS